MVKKTVIGLGIVLLLVVGGVFMVRYLKDTPNSPKSPPNLSTKDVNEHDKTFYSKKEHTIVDVLYGTDRGMVANAEFENRYNSELSKLKFGVAQVSVPKTHEFGVVERPMFFQSEKIGRDVVITKLDALELQKFRDILKLKLTNVKQSDILVFIHGFNVTFAEAIRQTAQISYDLEFLGIPITYSWPSDGKMLLRSYARDAESVKYTTTHLTNFLEELIRTKGDAKIHLLAHSMGTRALSYALKEISHKYSTPQFKNIILAAPDINTKVFEEDLYPFILKTTEKITLYASSEDSALSFSKGLHKGKRLGQGGEEISVFKDMVTIDATGIDTSLLGHSYFSEKEILVNDLRDVVQKSLPPQKRSHLIEKIKKRLFYWKFDVPEVKKEDDPWLDSDDDY